MLRISIHCWTFLVSSNPYRLPIRFPVSKRLIPARLLLRTPFELERPLPTRNTAIPTRVLDVLYLSGVDLTSKGRRAVGDVFPPVYPTTAPNTSASELGPQKTKGDDNLRASVGQCLSDFNTKVPDGEVWE